MFDFMNDIAVTETDSEDMEAQQSIPMIKSVDSLDQYLTEINAIPLLTKEDEIALSRAIKKKNIAIARIENNPETISQKELADLEADILRGEEAKQHLINANLRWVVAIARKYVGRGLSFLDLIQDGNLGLIRAAEKFDHEMEFKFSTYATHWIQQSILRGIAYSRAIRLPVHLAEGVNKLLRTAMQMQKMLGHSPSCEAIAEETLLPVQIVANTMFLSQTPVELDAPVGEDGASMVDFIPDPNFVDPETAAINSVLKDEINVALSKLSQRERSILTMRYGLNGHKKCTSEEIGEILGGFSREYISQTEQIALRKLHNMKCCQQMIDFL